MEEKLALVVALKESMKIKDIKIEMLNIKISITPEGIEMELRAERNICEDLDLQSDIEAFVDEIKPFTKKLGKVVSNKIIAKKEG